MKKLGYFSNLKYWIVIGHLFTITHAHFTDEEMDFFTRFHDLSGSSDITPFEIMSWYSGNLGLSEISEIFSDLEISLIQISQTKSKQQSTFQNLFSNFKVKTPSPSLLRNIARNPYAIAQISGKIDNPILGLNPGDIDDIQKLTKQIIANFNPFGKDKTSPKELDNLKQQYERKKAYIPIKVREAIEEELENHKDPKYLKLLLNLPWGKTKPVRTSISKAKGILDKSHNGLEKVKERILEFLAVQKRVSKNQGKILLLEGPPGVGKTTIVASIAKAVGRPFARAALGGKSDESVIRGWPRSFVHPQPGKIIKAMSRAGYSNSVIMLDEIDKLSGEHSKSQTRGDPMAALLELLDPEQNTEFEDHYLEIPYDLSSVMFIATANSTSHLPAPLLDRLEIIKIGGYTREEKLDIAKQHLIPKRLKKSWIKNRI